MSKPETNSDSKSSIEDLIHRDVRIAMYEGDNAKAFAVHQLHGIDRKRLCIDKTLTCSNAGITRAKISISKGYDSCKNGRHNKLCKKDEAIIEHWLDILLQQNDYVYLDTLIQLVCFFFLLLLLQFNYH